MKQLWPVIPTAAIIGAFMRGREEIRRRGTGSFLTVTDAVDRRLVRWAKLSVGNWTVSPAKLVSVRVLWPLSVRLQAHPDAQEFTTLQVYEATYSLTEGGRAATTKLEFPAGKNARVTLHLTVPPALVRRRSQARVYVLVTIETVDAQRRRERLLIRSGPVDWAKPPQV